MGKMAITVEYACRYGIRRAIIIEYLKNKINSVIDLNEDYCQSQEGDFVEGRHWARISINEILEELVFLKKPTVNNCLKYLLEKGIVEKRNLNKNKYDRTLWYSFYNEEEYLS